VAREFKPGALVLFDIDGTLIRRAGPHHRKSLEAAVKRVTGVQTTTEGIPTQGMLDRDILRIMMREAGVSERLIRESMQEIVISAQSIYVRQCPALTSKVCPGARMLLWKLHRRGVPTGLVTGNLTAIGWKKMESAGLKRYLHFGAFAELARDRAGLVRIALGIAKRERWIDRQTHISLIGDHPNDIRAARANGIQAIAVATGVVGAEELASHSPDLLVDDLRALPVETLLK
jgi:phosphoglycolate phosphatase